jgi:hypothetical protein
LGKCFAVGAQGGVARAGTSSHWTIKVSRRLRRGQTFHLSILGLTEPLVNLFALPDDSDDRHPNSLRWGGTTGSLDPGQLTQTATPGAVLTDDVIMGIDWRMCLSRMGMIRVLRWEGTRTTGGFGLDGGRCFLLDTPWVIRSPSSWAFSDHLSHVTSSLPLWSLPPLRSCRKHKHQKNIGLSPQLCLSLSGFVFPSLALSFFSTPTLVVVLLTYFGSPFCLCCL